jgi:hypothetical protein
MVYLKSYKDGRVARLEIGKYIQFYKARRPHQSLGYKTPAEEYAANAIDVVRKHMLESGKRKRRATGMNGIAGSHLNFE